MDYRINRVFFSSLALLLATSAGAVSSSVLEKRIQTEEIDAPSQQEVFEFMPAARLEAFLKFHAGSLVSTQNGKAVPLCLAVIELGEVSAKENSPANPLWVQSLKRRFQRRGFLVREFKDEVLMEPLRVRLNAAGQLEQKFDAVFESFAAETKRLGCLHRALFLQTPDDLALGIEVQDQYHQAHRAVQVSALDLSATEGEEQIRRAITKLTLSPFESLGPKLVAGRASEAETSDRSPASLAASLQSSSAVSSAPALTAGVGIKPRTGDFMTVRIEGFRSYAEYEIVKQKLTSHMEGVRSVQEKKFWFRGAELEVDTLYKPKEFGNLILTRLGAQVTLEKVEAQDGARELRLIVKDTAPEAETLK